MTLFILARTNGGRPSLQHALDPADNDRTQCGLEVFRWSRAYTTQVIPQIVCKKCLKKV